MAKGKTSRSGSKSKGKKGKRKASPPPPPIVLRVRSQEDFENHILNHRGSALLAIVTAHCKIGVESIVPFMEKLNDDRPPIMKDTNLVVMYTDEETRELCQSLEVNATPAFKSYSYGNQIESFAGDNVEKALLIGKMACQAAQEEEARLMAEAKLQGQQEG